MYLSEPMFFNRGNNMAKVVVAKVVVVVVVVVHVVDWVKLLLSEPRQLPPMCKGEFSDLVRKLFVWLTHQQANPSKFLSSLQQPRKQLVRRKGLACWWQWGNALTFWTQCCKTYSSPSLRLRFFTWCSPKALRKELGACLRSVSTAGEVNAKEMLFRALWLWTNAERKLPKTSDYVVALHHALGERSRQLHLEQREMTSTPCRRSLRRIAWTMTTPWT